MVSIEKDPCRIQHAYPDHVPVRQICPNHPVVLGKGKNEYGMARRDDLIGLRNLLQDLTVCRCTDGGILQVETGDPVIGPGYFKGCFRIFVLFQGSDTVAVKIFRPLVISFRFVKDQSGLNYL